MNNLSNEISIKSQRLLHSFLTHYGMIYEREVHFDKSNYFLGDETITLIKDNYREGGRKINIDYKRDVRKRPYLPIELIQVSSGGKYDSWLYNNNIHFVVYEYNDNTYIFSHKELLAITANYYNNEDLWNTCIVYKRDEDAYAQERLWIGEKLKNINLKIDVGEIPSESGFHINGCFNRTPYGKKHSGFCINLPLTNEFVSKHTLTDDNTNIQLTKFYKET